MKRRIAISAGHSNTPGKDRGAYSNGYNEGDLTAEFRKLLVEELNNYGVKASVDPDNSVTYQTVALFKQYFNSKDILVDIHFNASEKPNATGCEVLVPAAYTTFEKALAGEICLAIQDTLGIANRGVKTELDSARKKLLWMSVTAENILLEICFISNREDVRIYQERKRLLAKNIAFVLVNHIDL